MPETQANNKKPPIDVKQRSVEPKKRNREKGKNDGQTQIGFFGVFIGKQMVTKEMKHACLWVNSSVNYICIRGICQRHQ